MLQARDVANYFLGTFDAESGDNISNLKLQKLLYYAQGFHLAMHEGEPLFLDPVEAWDRGPVVRSLYQKYKSFGWGAIERPSNFDMYEYLPETRELLDVVSGVYGQYTAKRLERMTHQEPPWNETPRNEAISIDSMRSYFTDLVEAGSSGQPVGDHPVWPTDDFRFQNRKAISRRLARHGDRLRKIVKSLTEAPGPWAGEE